MSVINRMSQKQALTALVKVAKLQQKLLAKLANEKKYGHYPNYDVDAIRSDLDLAPWVMPKYEPWESPKHQTRSILIEKDTHEKVFEEDADGEPHSSQDLDTLEGKLESEDVSLVRKKDGSIFAQDYRVVDDDGNPIPTFGYGKRY